MPADPIIHCLQELTDYDAFERLCSAIMDGIGYQQIEPLGGRSDRGRDALYHSSLDDSTTIFAYTVRDDWKAKLNEDCTSIAKHQHVCSRLVYVCTSRLSAGQKEKAKTEVEKKFGWRLDVYDLERLRVLLAGSLRHLIPKHPQIFCWPYFDVRGGVSIAFGRDLVVIDHCEGDHAFAAWLTRRLQLEGYSIWCFGLAPMAGESSDRTVRELIANRAVKYLPVLTPESCRDSDFLARVTTAICVERLAVPIQLGADCRDQLPSKVRELQPARFDEGWATGLKELLDQFDVLQVPKRHSRERGQQIAVASFVPTEVVKAEPEPIYTNTFRVTRLPTVFHVFSSYRVLGRDEASKLSNKWAFARLSRRLFASFQEPPSSAALSHKYDVSLEQRLDTEVEGRALGDIVKELVRSCLEVVCVARGLQWCEDREVFYFPGLEGNPQSSVPLRHPDGRTTTVHVTGFRQWGQGEKATKFAYQLGPMFRVTIDEFDEAWVLLRIYVRVTEMDGTLFEGKAIGKRRKRVTKSWWNNHFFARLLGIVQYLADGSDEICIGEDEAQVRIATAPLVWTSPVSIDEVVVEQVGDYQEELAELNSRYVDDDEEDTPSGAEDQTNAVGEGR